MNDIATLDKAEQDALTVVGNWVVASDQDYINLDGFLVALADLKKKIVDDFADSKRKAFEAHRAITAQESAHLAKVDDARKLGKSKLRAWDQKQEEERQLRERALQALAETEAERQQIEDAMKAEAQGDKAGAEAILEAPTAVPTVVLSKSVPARSTKIRMVQKFRLKDPLKVKREFLTPDEVKIGQIVRSLGKAAEEVVGGIEWYEVPA